MSLDQKALFEVIKSSDSKLKSIEFLDTRLANFESFIKELERSSEKNLDKDKMAVLIADSITPVLFHKRFISTMDNLIGFLDEKDLTVIFEALEKTKVSEKADPVDELEEMDPVDELEQTDPVKGLEIVKPVHELENTAPAHKLEEAKPVEALEKTTPAAKASQMVQFFKLIRSKDKAALMRQFMLSPEADQDFDFDKLPIKKVVDDIEALINEVLNCHCTYNDHDTKGYEGRAPGFALSSKISEELSNMKIEAGRNFFSEFARKVFYIQGIRNGLNAAGEVNADSNQHVVKLLQRVKTHILRPLWWSTNISKLKPFLYKGMPRCCIWSNRRILWGIEWG